MTVLEVHDRKPYKIMDRRRELKKGVMAESLEELIERGKMKYLCGRHILKDPFVPTIPGHSIYALLNLYLI